MAPFDDDLQRAYDVRYYKLMAHWLATDTVFWRAYALMRWQMRGRKVQLTCTDQDPTIFPAWDANDVRAALRIPKDATWFAHITTLEARGWLSRVGWGGEGPPDGYVDPQHSEEWYDITCTAPAIVWLAEQYGRRVDDLPPLDVPPSPPHTET